MTRRPPSLLLPVLLLALHVGCSSYIKNGEDRKSVV